MSIYWYIPPQCSFNTKYINTWKKNALVKWFQSVFEKLKTKILRVDAKLHYSLLYTKQNWSKTAQFFWLIIALGDNLTNFFHSNCLIRWHHPFELLLSTHYLWLWERFRHAESMWGKETASSFQLQLFLWDLKKDEPVPRHDSASAHSFARMLWTYSVLATRLKNSIKHVCIKLKLRSKLQHAQ